MIKIKNIPNILTFSRIILCPIWFLLVLYNYHFSAFILIIYISLTDYFDGLIARKLNALSSLGKILDPIADKIFISTVLITFVSDARANLVLSIIIISRELVISCLREVLSEQNKSNICLCSLSLFRSHFDSSRYQIHLQLSLLLQLICQVIQYHIRHLHISD